MGSEWISCRPNSVIHESSSGNFTLTPFPLRPEPAGHAGFFNHSQREEAPASPSAACSAVSAGAISTSNCQGALSSSRPLPFMRSGESSGRTSSSMSSADLASQRRRRALEPGQRAALLDRVPQREHALRPAREALADCRQGDREFIQLGFERRVDQHQPARELHAIDARGQQGLDSRVAIALVHGHARIGVEIVLERGGFIRQQLAGGDAVVVAQRVGEQPWRAGVGMRAMLLATGAHGGEVALDRGHARRFGQQPGDAVRRLVGALRRIAVEVVQPAPGMGVQRKAGGWLGGQGIAQGSNTTCLRTSAWLPAWKAWR